MPGKTLITGGAGFIGSHLSTLLKSEGRQIILLDDLSTGRQTNIKSLLSDHVTFIQGRVGDVLPKNPQWLKDVDQIFHLAAAVGVKLVVDDPVSMIHNNIAETEVVLEAARHCGASVLVTSSSEVYGKGVRMPLSEEQDLVIGPTSSPRWSYALSKALDEHLALAYQKKHGVGVAIVRLFNTVGPRQVGRYGMVVPRFVRKALNGEDIEIYGSGQQTRAFCDVRDVVQALRDLLGNPAHYGKVFNVGSDREITVEHLADRVIELTAKVTGKRVGKKLIPYEVAYDAGFEDPQRRVPDLTRLRQATGYEPRIPLDKTLQDIIDLMRQEDAAN